MNLFETWGIAPKYPYVGQIVTKKQFKQKANLSAVEAKLVDSEIMKIKLAHGLNPQMINIQAFKDEIYIFEGIIYLMVDLKSKKNVKKLAELIHQSIQQPTFLIFKEENTSCFSSAIKRLNVHDEQRVLIEECEVTRWLNLDSLSEVELQFVHSLALRELPHHDFYEFYKALQAKLYNFNHLEQIGKYPTTYSPAQQHSIEQKVRLVQDKQKQLNQIVSQLKKETQFNKKLILNEEAIKLQKEIEELKNK